MNIESNYHQCVIMISNKIKELTRRDEGSTMVEFALIAPLLATILIAIVEFGTIMFSSIPYGKRSA